MEPLTTIEGYRALQSQQKSRDLLNNYYRNQGYEVITPNTPVNEKKEKESDITKRAAVLVPGHE